MDYRSQFMRLQAIVVADDSTDEQRSAARDAQAKLVHGEVAGLFARFEQRTADYQRMIQRLTAVIDGIHANQLVGIADEVTSIVTEAEEIAKGSGDAA